MDFKNTKVFNFEGALRGMRNPLNSWEKTDSIFSSNENDTIIGTNDLRLAKRLINGGPEHAKFMRQIFTTVDITAPLYWWKEADTYKVGTTANSTSTMHKLMAKQFERDDFEFDKGKELIITKGYITHGGEYELTYEDYINDILYMCNRLRDKFLETNDKDYWRALVQILPNAYLQTRTWTANYAILRNIYFQRRNHKLKEWHQFCDWIKSLPYSTELITLGDENEN